MTYLVTWSQFDGGSWISILLSKVYDVSGPDAWSLPSLINKRVFSMLTSVDGRCSTDDWRLLLFPLCLIDTLITLLSDTFDTAECCFFNTPWFGPLSFLPESEMTSLLANFYTSMWKTYPVFLILSCRQRWKDNRCRLHRHCKGIRRSKTLSPPSEVLPNPAASCLSKLSLFSPRKRTSTPVPLKQ